jgi:hypothetical protein
MGLVDEFPRDGKWLEKRNPTNSLPFPSLPFFPAEKSQFVLLESREKGGKKKHYPFIIEIFDALNHQNPSLIPTVRQTPFCTVPVLEMPMEPLCIRSFVHSA